MGQCMGGFSYIFWSCTYTMWMNLEPHFNWPSSLYSMFRWIPGYSTYVHTYIYRNSKFKIRSMTGTKIHKFSCVFLLFLASRHRHVKIVNVCTFLSEWKRLAKCFTDVSVKWGHWTTYMMMFKMASRYDQRSFNWSQLLFSKILFA